MLLTALRDPVWAFLAILLSPIRSGKRLLGIAIIASALGFVFMGMMGGQAMRLGFPPGTTVHILFETLVVSYSRPSSSSWSAWSCSRC